MPDHLLPLVRSRHIGLTALSLPKIVSRPNPLRFCRRLSFLLVLADPRVDDLLVGDSDVPSRFLKVERPQVREGSINDLLFVLQGAHGPLCLRREFSLLMLRLLLPHGFLEFYWHRVLYLLYFGDIIVAQPVDVDPVVPVEIGASHVAVEADRVCVGLVLSFDDVKSIGD